MCGICGIVRSSVDSSISEKIDRMTHALHHRGPDGSGRWIDRSGRVGLGHTRLAIIDPAGGAQPMRSMDERYVLVFNGEIYNFQTLRNELKALGRTFQTKSDTEVLLEALVVWGVSCLAKLHGMFAFALYDTVEEVLFLARDRTGIKPLYYGTLDGAFCFASELKALRVQARGALTLNYQSLLSHLSLAYTIPPDTFFAEIRELTPGTWLRVTTQGIEEGRFWSWKRQPADWTEPAVLERSEQAILESLSEQLVADTPLGAFLSGGIDSSLLVAMIAMKLGRKLPTFTVKFAETSYDESRFAGSVARRLGTDHHEIQLPDGRGDLSVLDEVLTQFDQPFGDSSAVPTYFMCRAVRPFAKVMIGGDGGDEMFGGYPRFIYADVAKKLGMLPQSMLAGMRACCNVALTFSRSEWIRQIRRLIMASEARGDERLLVLSSYVVPTEYGEVFSRDACEKMRGQLPAMLPEVERRDASGGAEFIDATITTALPGDYLRKIDMMSSMHGLEVRVPFLGEPVLDCSSRISDRSKYSLGQSKRILRALAQKYLPEEICRRPKTGFRFPFDTWLGEKARREVCHELCSPKAKIRELIHPAYVERMSQSFVGQRWDDLRISRENLSQRVYGLWGLERWLQRWRPNL